MTFCHALGINRLNFKKTATCNLMVLLIKKFKFVSTDIKILLNFYFRQLQENLIRSHAAGVYNFRQTSFD